MVMLLEETIKHNFGTNETIVLNLSEGSWQGDWIENVWKYIFEHFSEFLSNFAALPLLPQLITGSWEDSTWKNGEVHLYSMNRMFLLKSDKDIEELSNDVCNAFKHLSVVVLPSLPSWLDSRQFVNVYCPTGPRLVQLMEHIYSESPQLVDHFNARCQPSDAEAFVSLLERITSSMRGKTIITFLQQIKLFALMTSSTDMHPVLSSISENNQIIDANVNLPVQFPKPLLVSGSQSCMAVARKLGAIRITEEQLVIDTLRALNYSVYNSDECDKFMAWLLARVNKYQGNKDIIALAQNIAFVSNGVDKHKPSDLFDPRDKLLALLFSGENKFPSEQLCSKHNLNALKLLGLRTIENITSNCLFSVAKKLDQMCKDGARRADVKEKAKSLLSVFEKRPDILSSRVASTHQPLYVSIYDLKCLLHQKEQPADYPEDLFWKGSEFVLCSARELRSLTFSNIAGTVIPLIHIESSKVSQLLNLSSNLEARVITKQLENLIKAYNGTNKPYLSPLISNVYKTMKNQRDIFSCLEFQRLLESHCIWWGDGFCSPGQVVVEKQNDDIDLKPYMYPLPGELESLKQFFEQIQCNKRQDISVLLKVLELVSDKHRTQEISDKNDVQKDLQLVMRILNKLFHDNVEPEQYGDRLLFPVHTGDDSKLVLKSYTQCTYCDAQWLKELTEDNDDDIVYVHTDVSSRIAEGLGVKSLKRQLMSDAEGLEEWGQKEPLTRRLHNILKDAYVDGLAVPKEIIQNADDAGATTVHFIYDERENWDARKQLLDEGMAGCQGPALWAYNNAQFSESDLKNITKLSGATKETDTTKIGKFGLGFCAVYNLTDVPSFISGQNMVIFDPHTTHLNKALPGNSPGLRINLMTLKNQRLLKRMNNQFKPFHGVLGCDLLKTDPSFQGTLFRLPLRTGQQAVSSEIRNISYSKEEMVTLLKQLAEAIGNVLLFTQNLREIKVLHIPPTDVDPTKAILLCEVTKEIQQQSLDSAVLDACSKLKANGSLCSNPFSALQIINVKVECKNQTGILASVPSGTTQSQWLVSWATGKSKSLELSYSTNIKGALPLGSVAIYINTDIGKLVPKSLSGCPFGFYKTGHIFCYLPLPVQSNLNFHVNGSFAVTSDRRSLQMSTEDDKYCSYDSKWNDALLSDAVSEALVNALINLQNSDRLKLTCLWTEYMFHQFWPTKTSSLSRLTTGFYRTVMEANSVVFQTFDQRQWLGIEQCLFLDKTLTQNSGINCIALSTLQRFGWAHYVQKGVVDIPGTYLEELQGVNDWNKHMKIVCEEEFFLNVFLPNIGDSYWEASEDTSKARRCLMLHCLTLSNTNIKAMIQATDCIPTRPNGLVRKPQDLVHPDGVVANLFSKSDERFPEKEFDSLLLLQALVHLGMMKDTLHPELVKDRAKSIVTLTSAGKFGALERCRHFIGYLSRISHSQEEILRDLDDVEFLPVLKKPDYWPFKWKAEMTEESGKSESSQDFTSPKGLFLRNCESLIACEEHILDETSIEVSASRLHVLEILGVRSLSKIKPDTVIRQLLRVCNHIDTDSTDQTKRATDKAVEEIYQFLNRTLAEQPDKFNTTLLELKDQSVIRIGSEFFPPSKVAFSLEYDCSPELYGIQNDVIRRYKTFLKAIGVKDKFEVKDLIDILKRKKSIFQDTILPQNEFQIIFRLILCLSHLMIESRLVYEDISEQYGKDNILAPDNSQILRPTHMLCFDDCDDIEPTVSMKFVHKDVSPSAAERLGVLTKRTKQIEDCSIEIPFEQKEELVTRLKRLLDGYPCDAAVLKELMQNADDAGATEIHFVKDFRTHACSQIFESGFEEFQGPALLVYNDSSFTQADLKGIQQLGIGSKSDDPAKTGQYGVGFNAVYNLTDLPSFLTKGPGIEGGETLCIFDPLHKHSKKRVGTRYVDMKVIRKSYPDVFSGYNEAVLFKDDQQKGTVFRFPLRQSASEISSAIITQTSLENVFRSFKLDLSEIMLFLKSITKVTVSTISDGMLKTERSVSVILSDEDRYQRDLFCKEVKRFAVEIKNDRSKMVSLDPLQVNYRLRTKDNLNRDDEWYIVQRIGLEGSYAVPETVETAAKDGKLGMLPIGGVAVHLPKETWKTANILQSRNMRDTLRTRQREKGKCRPYCFLPLPGTTGLPMHINGHFILDHEARRGLWKKEHGEDFKSAWNNMLMQRVISLAYVFAIVHIKAHIFQEDKDKYSDVELIDKILKFDGIFPITSEATDQNWKYFVQYVLQRIVDKEEKLFPVVMKHGEMVHDSEYSLRWYGIKQMGHRFPLYVTRQYDVSKSAENKFNNLLRLLGMKIASMSHELQSSFSDSSLPVPELNASAAVSFLKSFTCKDPDKVKIDHIPCNIQDTLLRDISNVNAILKFCCHCDNFGEEIHGLPLLVTSDGKLRCFSRSEPVYCTKYEKLLPASAHKFVNEKQISTIDTFIKEEIKMVLADFHISDFGNLLCLNLNASIYARQIHVSWDPSTFAFPNKQWIKHVWDFFEEDFKFSKKSDDRNSFQDFLKPLKSWALIPTVREKTIHELVQISGSYSVLAIETFDANSNVQEALIKLHCPFLDKENLSDSSINLITLSLARAENPISVLQYLSYYKEEIREQKIGILNCCRILEYFSRRLEAMKKEPGVEETWIREALKSLPLFVTKDGQPRSFEGQDCKVLVIPSGIPEDGLQQLANSTGTILLQNDSRLEELHEYLGFTYTNNIDVYLKHVISNWDKLPDSAIIPHLEFIRDELLQLPLDGKYKPNQKELIDKLCVTPLIPDNCTRKRASGYYSPHHKVFAVMYKSDSFPPSIFKTKEWRRFLELIGMEHEVTPSLFIKYAQAVATEGRNGITETAKQKSNVLVDFMFQHTDEWQANIYQQISRIRFVIPFTVDARYTNVHKQYSDPSYFICFDTSISRQFCELVWSSLSMLPEFENSFRYYDYKKKRQLLGIHREPHLGSVISHTQNVCHSLFNLFETNRNMAHVNFSWIELFMEKIYEFLYIKGIATQDTLHALRFTPVVFIPNEFILAPAYRIIEEISFDQEISPYLLKAPVRYGKFFDLFSALGGEKYPSFMHYIRVLQMVKDEVKDNKLTDEYLGEWGVIRKALENLLYFLPSTSEMVERQTPNGTKLFLPTRDKYMKDSSTLTVSDNRYFEQRIRSNDSLKFLIDMKALKLHCELKCFRWLPQSVRPKFLSDIVKEKVDTSEMVECQTCTAGLNLERFIHSEHFIGAMLRLLKHYKTKAQLQFTTQEEETTALRIQNTRVNQVSGLKTYLTLNGIRVEESVEPKECFVSKPSKDDSDSSTQIFFQTPCESELDLVHSIDDYLLTYIHYILSMHIPENLLMKVLRKINDVESINIMLDRIPIDPYQMSGNVLVSVFPDPGTYVPEELHHLLNCDFSEIKPHEFFSVALELEDASVLDDNEVPDLYSPVYIYVRIDKKMPEDDNSIVTQRYEVFTGSEIVIVPAFRIYKFIRPAEERSTDVVDAGAMSQSTSTHSRTQIFYSIRRALQEAWRLPREDRRHVIKRLYLKWHPDKNIGNEKFCEEVFKYIKEIMYKLEHGIPIDDDDTDGSSQQNRAYDDFTSQEYFNFFERMNRRGRRHRDRAEAFYAPGPTGHASSGYRSGFSHRDSSRQPAKDFAEARRWQRQAEIDLRNARDTIDTPGHPPAYNWICYMCHQVCEISNYLPFVDTRTFDMNMVKYEPTICDFNNVAL